MAPLWTLGMFATYFARRLTKTAIRTIVTSAITVVIASPMLSTTGLPASSVLHHRLIVHILGIALSAGSGAWMTTRQRCVAQCRALEVFLGDIYRALQDYIVLAARYTLRDLDVAGYASRILGDMAGDAVLDMTTWKLYVVHQDHTLPTRLSTCSLLACMVAWLMPALARLLAKENLMHGFRVASGPTLMAAVEAIGARFPTATFRTQLMKVVGLLHLSVGIRVSRATQSQGFAN